MKNVALDTDKKTLFMYNTFQTKKTEAKGSGENRTILHEKER